MSYSKISFRAFGVDGVEEGRGGVGFGFEWDVLKKGGKRRGLIVGGGVL